MRAVAAMVERGRLVQRSILLITDPGPDPDDVKALIVAAVLHSKRQINLVGVIANGGGQPLARAKLARCVLNHLGVDVPVAVGSQGKHYEAKPHEFLLPGYEEVDEASFQRGPELLDKVLRAHSKRSLTVVNIAALTDLAEAMQRAPDLVQAAVVEVAIMGGLQQDPATGRWAPDQAVNNTFDMQAAEYVYGFCLEKGLPMLVVSRLAVPKLPMQLAESFALAAGERSPLLQYLASAQYLGLEGLWVNLCDGKLPPRCTKRWFVETFCGSAAADLLPRLRQLTRDTPMREHLNGEVLPYDVVALMTALPLTRGCFPESLVLESGGATHHLWLDASRCLDVRYVLKLLRETYHEATVLTSRRLQGAQAARLRGGLDHPFHRDAGRHSLTLGVRSRRERGLTSARVNSLPPDAGRLRTESDCERLYFEVVDDVTRGHRRALAGTSCLLILIVGAYITVLFLRITDAGRSPESALTILPVLFAALDVPLLSMLPQVPVSVGQKVLGLLPFGIMLPIMFMLGVMRLLRGDNTWALFHAGVVVPLLILVWGLVRQRSMDHRFVPYLWHAKGAMSLISGLTFAPGSVGEFSDTLVACVASAFFALGLAELCPPVRRLGQALIARRVLRPGGRTFLVALMGYGAGQAKVAKTLAQEAWAASAGVLYDGAARQVVRTALLGEEQAALMVGGRSPRPHGGTVAAVLAWVLPSAEASRSPHQPPTVTSQHVDEAEAPPLPVAEHGLLDIFVVHSWGDDNVAKVEVLEKEVAAFEAAHGRKPVVWLDALRPGAGARGQTLAAMPAALGRAGRLLILAGPTLPARLWCVCELVVWVQLGRSLSDVDVRVVAADGTVEGAKAAVGAFDAFHVMWTAAGSEADARDIVDALGLVGGSRVNDIIRSYLPLVQQAADKFSRGLKRTVSPTGSVWGSARSVPSQ